MKLKTTLRVIVVMAGMLVTFLISRSCNEAMRYKVPPPGWIIVSDGQGHWGAQFPNSDYVIDDSFASPLSNRQAAINRAWKHYNFQQDQIRKEARKVAKPKRDWKPTP